LINKEILRCDLTWEIQATFNLPRFYQFSAGVPHLLCAFGSGAV
jgi:hypothetical protein